VLFEGVTETIYLELRRTRYSEKSTNKNVVTHSFMELSPS
jgi:hypothetical protein